MVTKTAVITLKSSSVAGAAPTAAQLVAAEVALNTTDKKLYSSTGAAIFQVAPSMAEHDQKEPAISGGTTSQFWRGDKSWQDVASSVRASILTGLSTATSSAAAATDTILAAIGKLQAQLNLKAPLASPTLTGTPTVPTASAGTNTTQAASTAFVAASVAGRAVEFDVLDGGSF
jgi:hypothetical protein